MHGHHWDFGCEHSSQRKPLRRKIEIVSHKSAPQRYDAQLEKERTPELSANWLSSLLKSAAGGARKVFQTPIPGNPCIEPHIMPSMGRHVNSYLPIRMWGLSWIWPGRTLCDACSIKRLTKTQALQKKKVKKKIAGIDLHFPVAATAVGLLSFFIGAGCHWLPTNPFWLSRTSLRNKFWSEQLVPALEFTITCLIIFHITTRISSYSMKCSLSKQLDMWVILYYSATSLVNHPVQGKPRLVLHSGHLSSDAHILKLNELLHKRKGTLYHFICHYGWYKLPNHA